MKNSVSPSPPGTSSRATSGWWPPTGRRPWTAPGGAGIFRTSEQITRDFTGRRTQTRTPRAEESVLGSCGPCSGIVSESWQRPGWWGDPRGRARGHRVVVSRTRGRPRPFAPPRAAGWSPRPQATVTPGALRCPLRGQKWLLPPPRGLCRGPVGAGSEASAEGRGPPLATLACPASGTRGRASLALRPRLRTDRPFSPCASPAGRGGTGRPAVLRGCREEKQ